MPSRTTKRLLGLGGVLFLLSCLTSCVFPIEVPLTLAFGWVFYLYRVLPEVTVNPIGLAAGGTFLILFAAGAHAFLSWLYRETRGGRWRWRWTGSVVAVVLLTFTAGLAAAGVVHQVGWLLASPGQILGTSGMTVVYRVQSVNNLKQIGIAMHNYEARERTLPPGLTMDRHGELLHSWQTLILPDVEQSRVYDAIDLRRPWDDPVNATALKTRIGAYLSPAPIFRGRTSDEAGRGLTHYEGNVRVLGGARRMRSADIRDGAGTTILVGEVAGGFLPWGRTGHWRDPADGINRSATRGYSSPWPGGANFGFADGSVQFLKNSVDPAVLKALATPAGGETVSHDRY